MCHLSSTLLIALYLFASSDNTYILLYWHRSLIYCDMTEIAARACTLFILLAFDMTARESGVFLQPNYEDDL